MAKPEGIRLAKIGGFGYHIAPCNLRWKTGLAGRSSFFIAH
jgi:hypothetical protein